ELWVEGVISVNGVPWVDDGGVSGTKESSIDAMNGEVAGSGGIRSGDGSSDGSDSILDVGE
ncbi:hypothetical protein Tco_0587406, partial [Tanacetum coccineum]